ncbi:High-affinity glucose transporter OS=Kluyveromyces lactis (strain ATCC 8585 / CBS 2359 / DSM 70799 / NBRC 1267 / NRRL Y-1140 / WM37) GN=HGT1 PE=3 SV=1 [Rhizoctonia solani AG-1 IB]|uniref:High-affinity glucose transporter n=1 Tax=Thanatephorus cucumeris (strain AG1-IB / isolate 7/3/14) TaxID=1108050 RepID=A0A0B7FRA9_THACB|nr:High-affinity glucose transporter OS=Kluyveromyces lactis (strain ATCC 8585 / CBS 2359 / DSM 70799 / NBRC 1267 / NRRL Y-1140 / WM37) GN=HGT1 PE=3 SV=1 [Rhizoctonia solani AG-1 IB]
MGAFFNFFVATFAAIGSFLFGYDSGIIGSVISPNFKKFHEYFNEPDDELLGAVVSTFAGGCFFGAMAAGWLADRIGRKRTIQAGSLVAILGCSLQTGAQNISYLMVGRVIAGLAIGCLSMIVPLYQSEISPPNMRGFLTGMTQFMIGMGFLVANWVGYGCQYLNTDAQWRIPLAIQVAPAVLLLVGMFFLPFSPRWLVEKGRNEEALKVVQRLHGNEQNAEFIKLEFAEMLEQIKYEKANMSSKLSDLWATKAMLKRTLTGAAVQVCAQLSGINVSAYFQPSLYRSLGYDGNTILLITGINNALGQIVTFVFIYFILDRVGRRLPLIIGAFGMAGCLAIEAAINAKFPGETSKNVAAQQAGVAFIILFGSLFFSTSFGPVSWVYQSEIFPMRVRAMGTSVATMSNWAVNVMISQVSPIGLNRLGWKFYLVFICTNIANGKSHGLIVIFFFPETKGKTLEEMDAVFGDQVIEHALETGHTHNVPGLDEKDGSLEKIEKS